MTTYNSERYVIEQLKSIIKQSVKPDEIIICDDASNDRTRDVIYSFINENEDIPIELYVNKKNIGYLKNFEKCFLKCKGDIIVSCDSDDIWNYYKIERISNVFKDAEVVYAFHDISVTDSNLTIINRHLYLRCDMANECSDSEKVIIRGIQRNGMPNGMSMAFRKSLLDKIGDFHIEHDGWIYMCSPLFGKVVFIPEVLALYRRHDNNISGQQRSALLTAFKQSKKERFHMSPVLIEGFEVFFNRFNNRLSVNIKNELNRRIVFERTLYSIVGASKTKSIYTLLNLYKKGYTQYRGNWKLLIADFINIVLHNE